MLDAPTRARPPVPAARRVAVLQVPVLRLALLYFVATQLLDVMTTAVGVVRGLDEANPLTAGVLRHLGVGGLLLQKIPVVVSLAVGLSVLPRRVAVVAAWSFTLVMALVVASNLSLVLGTPSL